MGKVYSRKRKVTTIAANLEEGLLIVWLRSWLDFIIFDSEFSKCYVSYLCYDSIHIMILFEFPLIRNLN